MSLNRSGRRCVTAALVVAAAVVVTAAPSSAGKGATSSGGDARTVYAYDWSFGTGAVVGGVATDVKDPSPMGLNDYVDPTRTDVAWATPALDSERLTVTVKRGEAGVADTLACGLGSHYASGLTLLGNTPNWAQLAVGATVSARLRLNCTVGGVVHHLHWAEHQIAPGKWSPEPPTRGCVTLTRTLTGFTLAGKNCVVQDEIVSAKPGKQISTSDVRADFTATLVVKEAFVR
jgi:hypothetical protein